MAIAVILETDYTDDDVGTMQPANKFSYRMINFQKPMHIVRKSEKKKAIAQCVHFSYSITEKGLISIIKWLGLQKRIGIDKIVIYDSNGDNLFRQINAQFDGYFVEIRPYHIQKDDMCHLHKRDNMTSEHLQAAYDQCLKLYYKHFSSPVAVSVNRWKHQAITANDCYRTLSKTHEYVSMYDFDEIILPRQYNMSNFEEARDPFNCDRLNSICTLNKMPSNLYDYITNLVKRRFDKPITKLNSIVFKHGAYLAQTFSIQDFFSRIKGILIDPNSVTYPVKLKLSLILNYGHSFEITQTDLDYLKYLHETYTSLKCLYDRHFFLKKNFDEDFARFVYFTTNKDHQMGKCIHYTNNVKLIFTHYPISMASDTHSLEVERHENIVSHFRQEYYALARNLVSSINNVGVDVEYFLFVFRNFLQKNNCL
jgi:hypothetical protein